MKKLLALTLTLVLSLALAAPAFAADEVSLSPQALVFDGYGVEDFCAYNINGYNYFKLRDIAFLMSGTAGEFAVDWDADSGTVSVTTGGSYVYAGGELERGSDQSASAVPSPQTILIDGKKCDTLSVYNIGDNNYFKLRDLGEALGFSVDYDPEWNTAVVTSPKAERLLRSQTTTDETGSVTVSFTYDDSGRLTGYTTDDGSTNAVNTYNEYGVLVNAKAFGGEGEDAWEMETVYNGRGAVVSDALRFSDSGDETEYTYNDEGVLTRKYSASVSEYFSSANESIYDDQGLLQQTTDTFTSSDKTGETSVTVYTYDAQGRTVAYKTTGSGTQIGIDLNENGEWIDVTESYSYTAESKTVYEADRSTETVRTVSAYADGSETVTEEVTVNVYDAKGSVLSTKTVSGYGGDTYSREHRYTYDEAGRLLSDAEYYDDSETPDSVETYVYDADGHTLSDRTEYADGAYSVMTYTYDEKGNCVKDTFESLSYDYDWETEEQIPVIEKRSSTYTYDAEGRAVLFTSDEEGEHYERAFAYDDAGNEVKETVTINGEQTEVTVFVYG